MIKQFNNQEFQKKVQDLRKQYTNERILSFTFQNKKYWLKQPEKLSGFEKILKAKPIKSFQRELQRIITLTKQGASIPKLILWGDHFFVLEDAGHNIRSLINKYRNDLVQVDKILLDAIQALVTLHNKNIIHGRPALRDMLWQNGNVCFVDFESFSKSHNLNWLKARDGLIFIHSLGRIKFFTDEQLHHTINEYKKACDPAIWEYMLNLTHKYHWLYRTLYLFKPFARKDLIAIYRLFQQFDKIRKEE